MTVLLILLSKPNLKHKKFDFIICYNLVVEKDFSILNKDIINKSS